MSRRHDLHGDGRFTPASFFRELAAREEARAAKAAKRRTPWLAKVRGWVRWWLASPDWSPQGQPEAKSLPSETRQNEPKIFLDHSAACQECGKPVEHEMCRACTDAVVKARVADILGDLGSRELLAMARGVAHREGLHELEHACHCLLLLDLKGRVSEAAQFLAIANTAPTRPEGTVH